LFKRCGDPISKKYKQDSVFGHSERWPKIQENLSGKYGVIIVKGQESYATLWEYDKMICGREYIEDGSEVYFWGLETCCETVLEDRLKRIPPDSDMDKVAIAGFDVIKDKSREYGVEMGATIYQDKTKLFRIAGFYSGDSETVNKKNGVERLNTLGIGKDKYRAFIHTHVDGSVTFSGMDFWAAYLNKIPIYMKHVSDDRILKALAMEPNDTIKFNEYLVMDMRREKMTFTERIDSSGLGIDSCNNRDNSGENCFSQSGNYCSLVKEGLNFSYCQYGIFMAFGQKVEVVYPKN
jgi:hypothetical protein